jgi:predicted Zn-dependent peptidase
MKIDDRIEVCYIPADKFKTGGINITFCDNLCGDRAYKNALIPMILCQGTKNYPTARRIAERFQQLYGADFTTNVDKRGEIQMVQFVADFVEDKYANGNAGLFEQTAEMLLEIITNPLTEFNASTGKEAFREAYFLQERKNNNDFIRSLKNDKKLYAMLRCQETMCDGENYAIHEMGAPEDGDRLDAASLYEYYREYFLARTVVKVFVCCREEPLWLYDKLKVLCSDFTVGTELASDFGYREKKEVGEVKYIKEPAELAQGKLNIGFRTNVPPASDDFYALAVCNGIFGAGPHSKLFQNVREKNSLAYYAASRIERFKGLLIAYSGIDPANYEQAKDLILDQLREIQQGHITQEEYEDTVKMFMNSFYSYKDTLFSVMDFHINQILLGTELTIDEFVGKIKSVPLADVIRVSRNITLDTVYFLGDRDAAADSCGDRVEDKNAASESGPDTTAKERGGLEYEPDQK